jgi:hypothetical protein
LKGFNGARIGRVELFACELVQITHQVMQDVPVPYRKIQRGGCDGSYFVVNFSGQKIIG